MQRALSAHLLCISARSLQCTSFCADAIAQYHGSQRTFCMPYVALRCCPGPSKHDHKRSILRPGYLMQGLGASFERLSLLSLPDSAQMLLQDITAASAASARPAWLWPAMQPSASMRTGAARLSQRTWRRPWMATCVAAQATAPSWTPARCPC